MAGGFMTTLVPMEHVEQKIMIIRGHKVMIDADLAELYGVPTKRLNEQVKRNIERFPDDFMFQLTEEEKQGVVANCDHLKKLIFSHQLPLVFTEHGAIMLANVIKSPRAIQVSIQVVRAFVKLRQLLISHKEFAEKLDKMEKTYDHNFQIVFKTLRQLMEPPPVPPKKKIGFLQD
jgi:hypothetical protein